ncbi:hypothetical protein BVX94_01435 [bacterium B17]|nr:hypothetical protein BVX94_01435 [bacterium B17]
MNICHVLASLEVGGMERMVCTLVSAQVGSGDQSSVFCTDTEGEFFETVPAVSKTIARRRSIKLVVDWRVVKQLIAFVRKENIDILHAHNSLGQLYSVIASIYLRIPVVVTYHGQASMGNNRLHLLRRVLCRFSKCVIAISKDVEMLLLGEKVVRPAKLHTVHNGVDIKSFVSDSDTGSPVRRALGISDETFVIGTVGRLAREKNYKMLIRAFAEASEACQAKSKEQRGKSKEKDSADSASLREIDLKLLLVGDGPERERLAQFAFDEGLADRVIFAGQQSDMKSYYEAMDVFCLTSNTEGTSIALIEASCHGLPAIVTDVGGNSEVVKDGVSGIVVGVNDAEAMSSAMIKIINDISLGIKMGQAGVKHCSAKYSASGMASEYKGIYQEALSM